MPPNNPYAQPPVSGGAPSNPPYPGVPPLGAQPPVAGSPVQLPPQMPATAQPTVGSGPSQGPAPKQSNPNSTQNTLQLSEIRDNIVVMKDGTFRAVIACRSINFDLMSNTEREGVEYSYQNFLNSLTFPVQIVIRSQRVDIGPYIEHLVTIRRSQDNMLLGVLMDDYINFIDILSQEANIMEKSFFITVPFFPDGDIKNLVEQGKGFFGKLFAKPNTVTKIDTATYQKSKDEIKNRVDSVISGLYQIGIQSRQLSTKELGELYYNFYNPDTAVHQPLVGFDELASTYVRKAPAATAGPQIPTGGQY